MIPGYGLRPLTPAEQALFPGLSLAVHIEKARLIKPPVSVSKAEAGWIVWLSETYPGFYLMRLPGGVTLPVPHNKIAWTAVSGDEPATTVSTAKAMELQHRWQTAVLLGIRQSLRL